MNPSEKFLTICTATYNRCHTLPRLYESLVNQTNKNFTWFIIDDGSSDGTANLVKAFQQEHKIEIRFISQENKGKHFAVNKGLQNTDTDFFCVIDSDDFLAYNAVEEMEVLAEKTKTKNDVGAFTFIHFQDSFKFDKTKYGTKEWIVFGGVKYDWELQGEMVFCFKTKVHQQFYFPEFEGEKFCPESLVFRRIERQYKILVTDKVLAFGDYLEDGLSKNFYKLLLKNPNGALLNIKERFQDQLSREERQNLANAYWDIASKNNKSFKERFFGINPFLILKVLINKRKK